MIVWPYLPDSCSRSWITWLLIKYNCCKAEKMSSMASAIISTGSDDESYQSWLTDVCDWVVPEFGDLIMFVRLLLSCHGLLVCWIWPYLPDSYPRSWIAWLSSKYNCCKADEISPVASAIISSSRNDESYQNWLTVACDQGYLYTWKWRSDNVRMAVIKYHGPLVVYKGPVQSGFCLQKGAAMNRNWSKLPLFLT